MSDCVSFCFVIIISSDVLFFSIDIYSTHICYCIYLLVRNLHACGVCLGLMYNWTCFGYNYDKQLSLQKCITVIILNIISLAWHVRPIEGCANYTSQESGCLPAKMSCRVEKMCNHRHNLLVFGWYLVFISHPAQNTFTMKPLTDNLPQFSGQTIYAFINLFSGFILVSLCVCVCLHHRGDDAGQRHAAPL